MNRMGVKKTRYTVWTEWGSCDGGTIRQGTLSALRVRHAMYPYCRTDVDILHILRGNKYVLLSIGRVGRVDLKRDVNGFRAR